MLSRPMRPGLWWLGGKLRADDDADTRDRHRQSAWAIHSVVLRFAVIAWSFYPLAMNRLRPASHARPRGAERTACRPGVNVGPA
jgi:hypothetical protein